MQSDAPSDARPYAWENEIIGCLSIDTSASNFAGRYPTPPPSAHGAAHIDLPEFLDAALTPDSLVSPSPNFVRKLAHQALFANLT